MTMRTAPQALPTDVRALVNQTIDSLRELMPPTPSFVSDEIKEAVFKEVDTIASDMRTLNLAIHDNPELGFEEFKAHANLVAALKKLGFTVTNPSSLPTAFVATYTHGKGGRTFGFTSEFDALKDVGHGEYSLYRKTVTPSHHELWLIGIACGHNLIAVVGVAAAAGLKACLKACNISGTVKLVGSPAEEGGGGKVILLNEGIYDGIDACAMAHPEGGLARAAFEVEFNGKGAHAGAAPWMGINALDAAVQGYTAVSMLRQQLEPTMRVHGIITGSETWAPNIIPKYAKVIYNVRALDVKATLELRKKALTCFTSAAASTGCTYETTMKDEEVYADLRNNSPLAESYADFMGDAFGDKITLEGMTTASTDFGNVCYKMPAFHPGFRIPAPLGSINHTAGFTEYAGKPEAHRIAMKVAKGLACMGAKFLTDDDFAKKVRKEFEKFKKEVGDPMDLLEEFEMV